MLFGLAACDSSETSDGTNTAAVVEDYTGPDYTQVISAEEVRDGVAFGDLIMGNPDAPVTMIEYASLTCGHCANFHMQVFPDFKEQYIKTGKVRLIYRNYTRDPADLAVGMLTRCVGPD
ncbi:MAG: thioredoxin domain-containing protein, partial [Proteobacteria bacterium]|nr:thioredoxin domain-containing protein [Pseudomonadota bacterium]